VDKIFSDAFGAALVRSLASCESKVVAFFEVVEDLYLSLLVRDLHHIMRNIHLIYSVIYIYIYICIVKEAPRVLGRGRCLFPILSV
jgi:hypothetical protein